MLGLVTGEAVRSWGLTRLCFKRGNPEGRTGSPSRGTAEPEGSLVTEKTWARSSNFISLGIIYAYFL
jgi:hypothetical protein